VSAVFERIAPFGTHPVERGVQTVGLDLPVGRLTAALADPADHGWEGEPAGTALLVPGYTGSKEDFRLLLPLLARQGIRALAYSRRGQADSAGPDDPAAYGLDAEAGDAVWIAGLLADRGPVHLLGHSLGGIIARGAVLARPELFADLVLLCSGPAGFGGYSASAERKAVQRDGSMGIWRLWAGADADRPDSELTASQVFERGRFAAATAAGLLGNGELLSEEPDRTAALAATGIRVLVARGADDNAWAPELQQRMAYELDAPYAVIPAAAHSPAQENPAATAALLTDFWSSAG
jgi:pimeloyl-ACP methyl ester carboxylesterase